jgi:glyoxylase-like metal-dependent hydrolase (beta-lactamase superfamily II)
VNIESLVVGPIQVNCFIITCPTTTASAIIDPGGDAERILNLCQSKKINLTKILLTHGHFDHIGAVHAVKAATGADIFMHKADEFLIEAAPMQAAAFGMPAPKTFSVDTFLQDGDDISIGDLKASVIETPGHSPGCVCFHFEHDLFAGDTLFYGGIGRTDLPGGNYNQILNSIKTKLFVLPDDLKVYCGHGPATTIGREKQYNPFVN